MRFLIRKDNLINEEKIYLYKRDNDYNNQDAYRFVDMDHASPEELYAILTNDEKRIAVFDTLDDAKLFISFKE